MANVDIRVGKKDSTFFSANPTLVLKNGQLIYNETTSELFIGDGITQLSSLTAINSGSGSLTLQQVTDNGNNTTNNINIIKDTDNSALTVFGIDNEVKVDVQNSAANGGKINVYDNLGNIKIILDGKTSSITKNGFEVATVNDIPTTATKIKESFTYSGSAFTLSNTPSFVYLVVFGGMVIHETTDYTLSGTTLTITNTDIINGDKIYITYEY